MGQLNITEIQLRMEQQQQQQQQLRIVYFDQNKRRGTENFCTILDLSTAVKILIDHTRAICFRQGVL